MTKQNGLNKALPPQTLFWCPKLEGKTQPLVISTLNITKNNTCPLATIADTSLTHAQEQRAELILKHWHKWQVSSFNNHRASSHQATSPYLLLIIQSNSKTELQQLLHTANSYCLQYKLASVLLVSEQAGGIVNKATVNTIKNIAKKLLAANIALHYLHKPSHHASIIANAAAVLVTNSWLGFEALLWQKKVITTGNPFYAGYGLTTDIQQPNLPKSITLTQLIHCVLINNSQAYCPDSKKPISPEQALRWLHQQNSLRNRFPEKLYAIGFTFWWRHSVRSFFQGSTIVFVKQAAKVPSGATAVIWGRRPVNNLAKQVKLYRLEDGFLRSVGLGALFAKPLSWVADSTGLYFDAQAPSDLENLLNQGQFCDEQLSQAAQLIKLLCSSNITKYNTGKTNWQRPLHAGKVLLVVGQVETDASIAYGASTIKHNMALLETVRKANPNAYIVYKAHPDVVAGARAMGQNEALAESFCNEVVADADISSMLQQVDEVHVITSLAGFEALLRGKKVYCYGVPFYAGWGLTTDQIPCNRRTKTLTLQQLVAGSLLSYPLYVNPITGYYSNALATAHVLATWRQQKTQPIKIWQKLLRKIVNSIRGKQ